MHKYHFYKQHDRSDCGATCLRMVCRYYGKHFSAATMQRLTACGHEGTSFFELKQAAESLGMEAYATRLTWDDLKEVGKPCILHWGGNHFVVLTRIRRNLWNRKTEATVIDPGHGFLHYNEADFRKHWQKDRPEGFALLLVPTERFGQQKGEEEITLRWRDLLEHVMPHRAALLGVLATLAVGGLLGMVFPFLTQAMIDRGIEGKNLHIISLLLLAQLMLSLGQLGNDQLRGWLTLKCTSQISISFIHRFLTKLTRLPLAFFETRNAGDIMQRISDNLRIQTFITNTIISTGISLVFFVGYSVLMQDFVESLPLGYDTKIGIDGDGLSSGQKQRILLARAVYHLPFYIFLDEATNALDSHTEQEVIRGMRHNDLYGDRTVVMVAHRLSTIRCADHIVVMENGGVAEQGTHEELLAKQGAYYRLVKNQL